VNPAILQSSYASTEVRRRSDGYPANAGDGTSVCIRAGTVNARDACADPLSPSPGQTYYYGAFVHLQPSGTSAGRFVTGRLPDASQLAVKWAFSTGTFAVAAPTVSQYGVIAPSNDGVVYAMQRGAAASGGQWPTAPAWRPQQLGGVVQSRSAVVPLDFGTSPVFNPLAFLGAQDGYVYAVNGFEDGTAPMPTGGPGLGWSTHLTPPLGAVVQAAPAGIFTGFGGLYSYVLVGTRSSGQDNVFYALDPADGTVKDSYAGAAVAPGRIGPISGMAAVDYGSPPHVYFASRARGAAPNNQTLWRLELGASPALQYSASAALGDIDSSPIVASDAAASKRVYVGSLMAAGTLYSLPLDLSTSRNLNHGDGQIRGFVFPDRLNLGDLYFATDNYVSHVTDAGGNLTQVWEKGLDGSTRPTVPTVKPSSPVLLAGGFLYVGGTDGRLYKIRTSDGGVVGSVPLGAGRAVVGAPSYDGVNDLIHVGTEAGIFYAVDASVPW
jgi:outer membrane protein assembly factor BamB